MPPRQNKNSLSAFQFRGRLVKIPEELAEALKKLKNIDENTFIIVEGPADFKALADVGVQPNQIIKWAGKTLEELLDEIEKNRASEIIDMLDADRTGRKKSAALYASGKIRINRRLKKIILGQIKSSKVEDLMNFLERN